MKHRFWVVILLLLSSLTAAPIHAQYEHLEPENWFPLELGNYWHYQFEGPVAFINNVVWTTERDSTVEGKRWVRLTQIYCTGGPFCQDPAALWYHWTDDDYLLFKSTLDVAGADTLLSTQPVSIFTVKVPLDTLQSWRVPDPVEVWIETNDIGSATDSTDLTLRVDEDIFFGGVFVYKIGDASNLIGAVVNGLMYGDTRLVNSVALPIENRELPSEKDQVRVDIYPNPFTTQVMISVLANQQGQYDMTVYNLLGQRVYTAEKRLVDGQEWRLIWLDGDSLPAGVYVVQIRRDNAILSMKSFVALK